MSPFDWIKLVPAILKRFIFSLVSLIPRDKNIWLYGSYGDNFIDNSKYLFIYASEHFPEIRHIWITNNLNTIHYLNSIGLSCYRKKSFKGIYYCLRSGIYIYSSYPRNISHPLLSSGAFLMNLWHGMPLKHIEFDITSGKLSQLYNPVTWLQKLNKFINYPNYYIKCTSVLAPSAYFRSIFSSAFKVSVENVLVGPYPRTIPFYLTKSELKAFIIKYEEKGIIKLFHKLNSFNRVWIYMPTWRDANPAFINEAIPDWGRLNDNCIKNNILLLIKVHFNTKLPDNIIYSNIEFLENDIDIYPLLPLTHLLITDYSSIFFDYSLISSKIIFYAYDLVSYTKNSRKLYFNYTSLVKDAVVHNFEELLHIFLMNDDEIPTIDFEKYLNRNSNFKQLVIDIRNGACFGNNTML